MSTVQRSNFNFDGLMWCKGWEIPLELVVWCNLLIVRIKMFSLHVQWNESTTFKRWTWAKCLWWIAPWPRPTRHQKSIGYRTRRLEANTKISPHLRLQGRRMAGFNFKLAKISTCFTLFLHRRERELRTHLHLSAHSVTRCVTLPSHCHTHLPLCIFQSFA